MNGQKIDLNLTLNIALQLVFFHDESTGSHSDLPWKKLLAHVFQNLKHVNLHNTTFV